MDKDLSIQMAEKIIKELTKEMHEEIDNFSSNIKSKVQEYSHNDTYYSKFKASHEGPHFGS